MIGVRVVSEGRLPLREMAAVLKNRPALLKVLGAEGVRQFKQNFRKLGAKPNALRAPSTGFWQAAAASTSFAVPNDNEAVVSVSHRGVRLQYFGGTVYPVRARRLAIPVHPAAHGKRPGDIPGLFPVQSASGQAGLARPGPVGSKVAEWVFVFKRSVTIRPHPEVLPPEKELSDSINARAAVWVQRQMLKANQS